MCGPENTDRPRGGALVALSPPPTVSSREPAGFIHGDLAFHTPGTPGSAEATHARLTPSAAFDMTSLGHLSVIIHTSGDLTRNAGDCGLFRQFSLSTYTTTPHFDGDKQSSFLELPLEEPLSLAVGNEGIIGRRVSLRSRRSCGQESVVAEGIVGFNFYEPSRPSL